MLSRSSISSSEPGVPGGRFGILIGTAACTFAVLAVMNYFLARITLPYLPDSEMARVVRFLRDESACVDPRPSVLFLGSSRFQSCILPEVFEARADEWGADVRFINAAHPAMEFWEYSRILPYVNLEGLHIRMYVVEMNPFTFNTQARHTITKKLQYYEREAPVWGRFRDVLGAVGFKAKTRLLWSLVFPRRTFGDWSYALRGLYTRNPVKETLPSAEYQHDPKLEAKQRADPNFWPQNVSQCHMYNYRFSETKRAAFEEFLKDLERTGGLVILVHPPVADQYFDYIRSDPRRSAEYEKHLAYLKDLSGRYQTLFLQIPEEVGCDNSLFVDYGHFTYEGARKFSSIVASKLKAALREM